MKMKKTIITVTMIALLGTTWSCQKALDIEPRQSIEATTALTTKDGISAAPGFSLFKNEECQGIWT